MNVGVWFRVFVFSWQLARSGFFGLTSDEAADVKVSPDVKLEAHAWLRSSRLATGEMARAPARRLAAAAYAPC